MEERKKQGLLGNIHDLLLESTFYNYSYIDLGRLAESSHGVDVVVEDDDPHHHPHAEHQRFFTRKPTPVLPEREETAVGLLPGPRMLISGSTLAALDSSNPLWRTIPDLHQPG